MDKVRSKTNRISKKGRLGNRLSWLIPSVLVGACIVFELVLAKPAYAAVFNIASGDVAGLINAINTANSNGQDNTINLAAGTYTLTAVNNETDGSNGLPSIAGKMTIKGAGADITIIANGGGGRVFHVAATGNLTLDVLTITAGGVAPCEGPTEPFNTGGGILNNGGTLSLNNGTISGNVADFCVAGGVSNLNGGTVTINDSIISGNEAGEGACGGILNDGMMSITNTIIDHNSAGHTGGICNGRLMTINHSTIYFNHVVVFGEDTGGISNGGDLTIIDSAIVNNSSGAAVNLGTAGGISNGGNLTIINSTIANNSGEHDNGGIGNVGNLSIINSTVANNLSGGTGGIFDLTGGTVQLQNTILALNTTFGFEGESNNDCSGQVTSVGNNIIGDTTGCTITLQSSDLTGDPGVGTFADNGTPGNGHFPLISNSQAINAGNNNVCLSNPILHTDQIGDPRVGICDIGSIEFEPFKNLGDCISTLIQQNCSGLQGNSRAACNHEQQTFCFNLFKGN